MVWARILLCGTLAGCVVAPDYENCAVRCGSGDGCPNGLTCLGDRYCHQSPREPLCGVDAAIPADSAHPDGMLSTPDAVVDAPLSDVPTACMPEGGDSVCSLCMKAQCCDPLVPCLQDSTCACYVQCYLDTGGTTSCVTICGVPNGLVTDLDLCRQDKCEAACSP